MASIQPSHAAKSKQRAKEDEARRLQQEASLEPTRAREHELAKLSAASGAASAEAQKERDFEAQQRGVAFERASSFLSPFLTDSTGGGDEGLLGAQEALEASIKTGGSEAQAELSGDLAKRGIFRSGSGAAASARLSGSTEAGVAKSRAAFAESDAERRRKERESQRTTALQLAMVGGGFA